MIFLRDVNRTNKNFSAKISYADIRSCTEYIIALIKFSKRFFWKTRNVMTDSRYSTRKKVVFIALAKMPMLPYKFRSLHVKLLRPGVDGF